MKKRKVVIILGVVALVGLSYPAASWYFAQNKDKQATESQQSPDTSRPLAQRNDDAVPSTPRRDAPEGETPTKNDATSTASDTPADTSSLLPRRATPKQGGPVVKPTQPATPTQPSTPTQPPATPPATPQPLVTPPVAPPTVPPTPQPPVNPPSPQPTPPQPTPPTPQPPVVTPPTAPETDEEKAKKLAESLKTTQNDNTAYFLSNDDQHRVALWTRGISAPRLGKTGELTHTVDATSGQRYAYDYLPFNDQTRAMGWFDADKSPNYSIADANLCFAAVSANQLHWWMAQNQQHITQYLAKTNYGATLPGDQAGGLRDLRTYQNAFRTQQDSQFFTMFKAYFGYNRDGYQVDPLNDLFINGYKPKPGGGVNEEDWPPEFEKDERGGFFYDVFGRKLLTDRLTTHQFDYFARQVKTAFQQGKSVGVIYTKSGGYTHVITAWGAEFDPHGKLTALYITDSDDVGQAHNGLQRMGIKNIDGRAALSNNLDNPRHGLKIDSITTLSLGEAEWQDFLK